MRDAANRTHYMIGAQVAFTFFTGVERGHEAAPLVVGDTMYVVTPYPNRLFGPTLLRTGGPSLPDPDDVAPPVVRNWLDS